ncbi:MAG: LacI family DNA-binding transcriptional regulator [Erysipelotrichaceae bacterium]|nr:LacI family DNA-binding transcriptional regulator [Erysipelotrichaceae bacterium]MBQ4251737.1 LacI family DNA-binding transcriptional regulator [Erysipelotrichaceae bacterium]
MVSIKDISQELGLAVSTVSMALNNNPRISEKTRKLVQDKARELKYVKNGLAVDLQKKKTNLILLILYDASRAFFSETIRQLQSCIDEAGYDFIISTTYGGHRDTAEKFIRERRSDAVIVYTKTIEDSLLDECASADFPIFVLGHKAQGDNPHVQSFLYAEEVKPLATCEYMIAKGHRRLGFVTGFAESYGTIRSMNGFLLSMKNHGLPVDKSLIFDAKGSQSPDGYRVCEEQIINRLDDMDGIIFSNDDIAIGAMQCFNDHNISIPEKVSVIGMHNVPGSAATNPPLTTQMIINDNETYYHSLVTYLVSCIEGKPDRMTQERLSHYNPRSVIVERQTVRDLTITEN